MSTITEFQGNLSDFHIVFEGYMFIEHHGCEKVKLLTRKPSSAGARQSADRAVFQMTQPDGSLSSTLYTVPIIRWYKPTVELPQTPEDFWSQFAKATKLQVELAGRQMAMLIGMKKDYQKALKRYRQKDWYTHWEIAYDKQWFWPCDNYRRYKTPPQKGQLLFRMAQFTAPVAYNDGTYNKLPRIAVAVKGVDSSANGWKTTIIMAINAAKVLVSAHLQVLAMLVLAAEKGQAQGRVGKWSLVRELHIHATRLGETWENHNESLMDNLHPSCRNSCLDHWKAQKARLVKLCQM